mgnify:CR=1 FL=1
MPSFDHGGVDIAYLDEGEGEPILLIHGEDDNNQGTWPIQSQRLFAAIKGHGGNFAATQH